MDISSQRSRAKTMAKINSTRSAVPDESGPPLRAASDESGPLLRAASDEAEGEAET